MQRDNNRSPGRSYGKTGEACLPYGLLLLLLFLSFFIVLLMVALSLRRTLYVCAASIVGILALSCAAAYTFARLA